MKFSIIIDTEEEFNTFIDRVYDETGWTWVSGKSLKHSERGWEWYSNMLEQNKCIHVNSENDFLILKDMEKLTEEYLGKLYLFDEWEVNYDEIWHNMRN